ncbi:MAG: tetratricopeptide repeat protein [Armatimonadetes bacterium]|nr:tetratricopeptide repeat protein [Armatimonadota bacterium]
MGMFPASYRGGGQEDIGRPETSTRAHRSRMTEEESLQGGGECATNSSPRADAAVGALQREVRPVATRSTPAALCVTTGLLLLAAVGHGEVPDAVVQRALAGDWEAVHAALMADDSQAAEPGARLLCAHSCLATNRNNDAFLLFMSLRDPESAKACAEWTRALVAQHGDAAVAQYLAGDSLARSGDLTGALPCFDAALAADPRLALARSARGATKALAGDMDGALLDLHQSTQVAPDLADAHANLGTLWVLQSVSPGAIESFDRAIQIDPDFALAHNGRGCARFGQGDYDGAIADLERAFGLCPALVPAGANEAVILAALAAEATPQVATERPGTTIMTRSELGRTDFTGLRTAQEIMGFDQSVMQLADTDYVDALRVVGAQRGSLSATRQSLVTELAATVEAIPKARGLERQLRAADAFIGLIPVSGTAANTVPGGGSGWKQILGLTRAGSSVLADAMPGTGAGMWAEVSKRTLAPDLAGPGGPLKALVQSATYLLGEGATTLRMYGEARSLRLSADLQTLNIQDTHLQGLQDSLLTRGLQQGFDFGKPGLLQDVLGLPKVDLSGSATGPLREYRIPAAAPVAAFGTLPGATGRAIAPAGRQPFVLVDGANLTDPVRLGAALRGYESLGAQTIPVPEGVDPARWAGTLGLPTNQTIVARITADPPQSYTAPRIGFGSAGPPGGVTMDMSNARIDRGKWPVMTTFALAYGAGAASSEPE